MASASDASRPAATQPELEKSDIGKKLVQMQKSIADSLGDELQPIRRLLQDLHLRQQQNNSLAAQRDAVLMELMKMYVQSGDAKAQGNESLQPLAPRSVVTAVAAAELKTHRSVLPSVEEEDQDGEDGLPADSLAHTSSAGESGDEVETYEPPDVLEGPLTGREYGLGSSYRRKAVGYTVAAHTPRRGQPESRNPPCNMDAAQVAPLAKPKPCNEPETDCDERKVGDGKVSGDDAKTQTRKRQRTASIIRQGYHVAQ
ncbi:hypothetical protein PMIN01_13434 [Paraphaeosphaeria minitans]|uniref:Uncharacterized protein n=1 Tax=Paraphaeosphaeria minitans TaxID=565426 RepID=A0A9P6KJI8_9PLEO|nr:hypothetical protein PMIN01_13434 [Paraphaeosphaeria minitans]